MRNEFRAFHIANDDEKINILSDEATLFVVDTNVLLDLYSLKEETRKLFFDFLEKSKDRLFLPHHVGLEYHNNRIQIIKKEVEDVSFIENKLFSKIESIFKEESIKNLLNKNPFLSEDIETLKKKVLDITKKGLELIIQKIKDSDNKPIYVNGDDHIKEKIYSIFEGKVGDSFTQEVLDSLYVEGEKRYIDQIPPGYADSPRKGEEEFIFSDITYKRKFGDLIIWKQIIKFIQNSDKEVKNVVFISGEKKKDWVNVVDSQGAKNLGARHELVEEIQREAKVEKFLLLSHEDYMRLGDKAFGITVSNAVLEDIEEHEMRSLLNQAHRNFIEQSQGLEIQAHDSWRASDSIDYMRNNLSIVKQLEALKSATTADYMKDNLSVVKQLEALKSATAADYMKDNLSVVKQLEALKSATAADYMKDNLSVVKQLEALKSATVADYMKDNLSVVKQLEALKSATAVDDMKDN